jgi:hypothetical protein
MLDIRPADQHDLAQLIAADTDSPAARERHRARWARQSARRSLVSSNAASTKRELANTVPIDILSPRKNGARAASLFATSIALDAWPNP